MNIKLIFSAFKENYRCVWCTLNKWHHPSETWTGAALRLRDMDDLPLVIEPSIRSRIELRILVCTTKDIGIVTEDVVTCLWDVLVISSTPHTKRVFKKKKTGWLIEPHRLTFQKSRLKIGVRLAVLHLTYVFHAWQSRILQTQQRRLFTNMDKRSDNDC